METPQLPLSETPEQPRANERDVDEYAQHIAETARPVEYVDRTSEAAREQGHGPIDLPVTPARAKRASRRIQPMRPVEYPSPGHNNNPDIPEVELTDDDKVVGNAGIAAASIALKQAGKQ